MSRAAGAVRVREELMPLTPSTFAGARSALTLVLALTVGPLALAIPGCSGNPTGSFDFAQGGVEESDDRSTERPPSSPTRGGESPPASDAGGAGPTRAPTASAPHADDGDAVRPEPDSGSRDASADPPDAAADAPGPGKKIVDASEGPRPEATLPSCAVTFTVNGVDADPATSTGVFVVGSVMALGAGEASNAVPMAPVIMGTYTATVTLDDGAQVAFKFLQRGANASTVEAWSPDLPRTLTVTCSHPGIALSPAFTGPPEAGASASAQGTTYVGTFAVRPEDAQ